MWRVPPGDDRERLVCDDCGFIHYDNPKIVVGAVVTSGDRFLLCRRAIPPRVGYWTIPAGYMELRETSAEGAARHAAARNAAAPSRPASCPNGVDCRSPSLQTAID